MRDIGNALNEMMLRNQCDSFCAFLMLEGGKDGVYIQESESFSKSDRGLCDKSNKHSGGEGMGGRIR